MATAARRKAGKAGRTAGSRARDRARHEGEILAAAERAFASRGYEAATVAAIAAEAKFSIATLYNFFESKDAILDRLLAAHLEALLRESKAAAGAARTARQRLDAFSWARVRYLAAHRDFFRLYMTEVPGVVAELGRRSSKAVARLAAQQLGLLRELFEALPARAVDAGTSALLFHSALRGYAIERVLKAGRPPSEEEVRAVVRGLVDGLG